LAYLHSGYAEQTGQAAGAAWKNLDARKTTRAPPVSLCGAFYRRGGRGANLRPHDARRSYYKFEKRFTKPRSALAAVDVVGSCM
jgi:hypothetical protein